MPDPLPQATEILTREIALERIELLQQNILSLRDDIPDMQYATRTIKQFLAGVNDDIQLALTQLDRLMERQQTWQEWLSNRLTLLANLKEWLLLEAQNNEHQEDDETV